MQDIKKIKNNLKASIKTQEFKNKEYLSLTFENLNKNNLIKTTKLTKVQYLTSAFINIKTKKEIKFPLEITTYNSENELTNIITKQKGNILSFIKIKNIIVLDKNTLKITKSNPFSIYSQLRYLSLRSIKLMILLKHYFNKKESQTALF
jgi:hypothetical protein